MDKVIPMKVAELLQSTPVVPNFESKWSETGRRMQHQTLRTKHQSDVSKKKQIRLDVGQPNAEMSLIGDIRITLANGDEVKVDDNYIQKLGFYGSCSGYQPLVEWLTSLQKREHLPPLLTSDDHPLNFALALSSGMTQVLNAVLMIMMDSDYKDTILMEEIGYVSFIGAIRMFGGNVQGVAYDDKGIMPEALEDILANWNLRHPGRRMPKILYTVSSASNPLGYNWDDTRKAEIYLICRKYDLLIIDDGAYYFLQFGKRPLSFQSLDVDGRVLHLDTFSKILGAGYRISWVSGPEPIIDKIIITHEVSSVHPSSITQAIVYSVLNSWGPENFEKHTRSVASFYQKRADIVIGAFQKYLTGLATWTVPKGGMFTFVTIPGIQDSHAWSNLLQNEDIEVMIVTGKFCKTEPGSSNCFRLCYSLASEEDMVKAVKCMADAIRKFKNDQIGTNGVDNQ